MTTVLAERFRAPVDGLTGPRIEDMLDVWRLRDDRCAGPDEASRPVRRSTDSPRISNAGGLAFMSSSNSELRHRKNNSMTTTIAASAAKVALQARQVVRPLLRRGVARSC
jgi:hypothetical protein